MIAKKSNVKHIMEIYFIGFTLCPIEVSVDGHDLLMISSDNSNVVPQRVKSFVIHNGERLNKIVLFFMLY